MVNDLYRGGTPITRIYRGATPVSEIYRGPSLIWTSAPIFDPFDTSGWLQNWINELKLEDLGALISDGLGALWDGLGNLVGSLVGFVKGAGDEIGTLVTNTGDSLVDAYCAAWGGTAPTGGGVSAIPAGLIGLVNGIPIIGPTLGSVLSTIFGLFTGATSITSLLGSIPVVGQLAQTIGLLPDKITGLIGPPINFVIDQLGNVLGTITCGAFTAADIHAIPEDIQYVIGVVQQKARMLLPDGLLSLDTRTSRYRWPTPLTNADGFLEVRLADAGNGRGMLTQVFRRYSDSGYHQGVGIQFVDGLASIVHRSSDTEVLAKAGLTSYKGGDRFRLIQAGSTHTLIKNGLTVGAATGIAAPGGANNSVGMLMQGGKELLGPVQYSPGLDYLEAA